VIFVTVGTNEARFDRLIEALDGLRLEEELVVQHGASPLRPSAATCIDFLPFDDLVDHVRRARVVVAHAGVGTVLVALANGKRAVVVPRLRRFGEAVDDHQVIFARRLGAAGLVELVEDPRDLEQPLRRVAETVPANRHEPRLASELRAYLTAELNRADRPFPLARAMTVTGGSRGS
jgi:UDP-N-acetylglucosamine transferase subunit ALG13